MNSLTNQQSRVFVWSLHLAGATVVAITLGGYYALVYQPLQRQRADAVTRIEQLDLQLLRSGTEGREYRQLRDQLAGISESVAELHEQLRSPQQETAFVADLRDMANEVGLDIVDTKIGVTTTLPTYSQREVALRCYGSYASVCRFLQQAEQFARTTKLSKFELAAGENSYKYPIQLTFVLYSEGDSHDTKQKRGVL